MSQSPAATASGPFGPVRLGDRAARALTAEFARHNGPKAGLLVGVGAGVAGAGRRDRRAAARRHADRGGRGRTGRHRRRAARTLASSGSWVADRVRVVDSLAEADPADVVIVGEPLTGTAEEARGDCRRADQVPRRRAACWSSRRRCPGGGAAAELDRQAALFGVGSDLVLRNTAAGARAPAAVHPGRRRRVAGRLAPAYRPSSVPLTRGMHIDSNGVAAAGIALGLAALARIGRPASKLWLLPALAAPPVAAFFRDPERDVPDDESAVVAASDGKVLSVERLDATSASASGGVPADRGLPVGARRARQPVAGGRPGGRLLRRRRRLRGRDEAGRRAQRGRVHGAGHRARHGGGGPAHRPDRPPDRAAGAGRRAAGPGRAVRPDPVRLPHRRLPAGRPRPRRRSPRATRVLGGAAVIARWLESKGRLEGGPSRCQALALRARAPGR